MSNSDEFHGKREKNLLGWSPISQPKLNGRPSELAEMNKRGKREPVRPSRLQTNETNIKTVESLGKKRKNIPVERAKSLDRFERKSPAELKRTRPPSAGEPRSTSKETRKSSENVRKKQRPQSPTLKYSDKQLQNAPKVLSPSIKQGNAVRNTPKESQSQKGGEIRENSEPLEEKCIFMKKTGRDSLGFKKPTKDTDLNQRKIPTKQRASRDDEKLLNASDSRQIEYLSQFEMNENPQTKVISVNFVKKPSNGHTLGQIETRKHNLKVDLDYFDIEPKTLKVVQQQQPTPRQNENYKKNHLTDKKEKEKPMFSPKDMESIFDNLIQNAQKLQNGLKNPK